MFEDLRDRVDRTRWKQEHRRDRKVAAKVLGVKRRNVYMAVPADIDLPRVHRGGILVAYFRPATPQFEIWCLRVDARNGCTVGDPIRFTEPHDWIGHAQERAYESAWAEEG